VTVSGGLDTAAELLQAARGVFVLTGWAGIAVGVAP